MYHIVDRPPKILYQVRKVGKSPLILMRASPGCSSGRVIGEVEIIVCVRRIQIKDSRCIAKVFYAAISCSSSLPQVGNEDVTWWSLFVSEASSCSLRRDSEMPAAGF